mmetsp:Transcript_50364/g.146114  ORF Transcript_50364/g.146114 Transcript_50364/m.146114 type:complete len:456 (-) Transcript_50364:163-1530(-)
MFVWTPGKMTPPTCANCKEKASVYCVDCKKSYCRFCAVLLHHPSTKNEKHSMEEIDFHDIPVKILSPVLLDLCLIAVGSFMLSGPGITADYFNGQGYCPALSRGRRWLAQTDANLFFYWKAHLSTYCDWEDSYWRFFVDTWVRGILTDTDAWILIGSQLMRAFIFEEFLRILVTPVVAHAYAIVASIIRLIEWEISFFLPEEQKKYINSVREVLSMFAFASTLAIKDKKPPPPPTLRRKRPMETWMEGAKYHYDRHTRLVSYYKVQAQTACRFVFRGTLKVAIAIRLACMLLGHTSILAWIHFVGLGELATKHTAWFAESTGMDLQQLQDGVRITNTGYSDWIAVVALQQAMQKIPFFGIGQDVGNTLKDGVSAILPLIGRHIIPLVLLAMPPLLCWWKLYKQKKAFAATWKSTSKEIFGPMSRQDPCASWDKVRFSPPESSKAAKKESPAAAGS